MRYGFVFNIERCNGCYSCFLACKDEHTGNCHKPICAPTCEGVNLMKLNEIEYGTGSKVKVDYVNTICQQCANPACMKKYPDQVYKRPDGIVIIDPEKAKGNRDMVNACPYGAIFWNEKEQLPQKCTMCAELLDDPNYPGFEPRCVEACPNQALVFGDLADPESNISKLIAANKVTQLECLGDMGSSVVHLNIPQTFLAGTVAYPKELEEVCIGANVKVTGEDGTVYETVTNWAGDWEIEDLPKGKSWKVEITFDGFKPVVYENERTDVDHYVGITYLEPAI